jgi:GH24 family phage-related lysozyme (muramidase)
MERLRENLLRHEDMYGWMYLDSVGKVTVGIGTRLGDAEEAKKLPFTRDYQGMCRMVSPEEIEQAYNAVAADSVAQVARYPKRSAGSYETTTDLRLPIEVAKALRDKHIEDDYHNLKILFYEFDSFPEDAQIALFDMIYNLGASGLELKFPRMNDAVRAKNWLEAARQSHRLEIQPERNYETGRLFGNAAIEASKGSFDEIGGYMRQRPRWR